MIAAVYGNRAYEDTLVQMQDYAQTGGFRVIAAISAVAEHSIIRKYASGRPDLNDYKELAELVIGFLKKMLLVHYPRLWFPATDRTRKREPA